MKAVFFRSLPYPLSSFFSPITRAAACLMLALLAAPTLLLANDAQKATDDASKPAAVKVIDKSPDVHSMRSKLVAKSMVQDVIRVGERLFLAGERGHIGWSDDNGKTWQQADVPTIQDINAVYFVSQELGWAVGLDGNIFNTIDGGKTWLMQLDGIAYNLVRAKAKVESATQALQAKKQEIEKVQAELDTLQNSSNVEKAQSLQADLDKLQDVADDLDFQIRDAKHTLEEENAPWPLMGIWFSDMNNGFAVGAFNAFLMTHDGGKTWHDVSSLLDNHDALHLNVIAGQGSTVFIGGEGGLLFRSRNAGATWEKLASPSEGSFYAMSVMPTAQPEVYDILAVGIQGRIYHSTNTGDTWTRVQHDINNNLNSIYEDGNGLVLIVGNDGAMLRSTNGGVSFETQHRFDQVTMSSVVVAANGDIILAGANGITSLKPDQWTSLK